MSLVTWGLALAIVALATVVQAVTGMGFGLVAVPLLVIAAPELGIVAVLVVTLLVMVTVAWFERDALSRRDLAVAGVAAVPGVLGGTVLALVMPPRPTLVLIGVAVVVASVAALVSWAPRASTRTLVVAGALGGVLTPVAALPGPPMVLGYRPPDVARMRSTLSAYFAVTSVLSLVSLAVAALGEGAGEALGAQVVAGLGLVPAVVAGALVSRVVVPRVPAGVVRRAALGLSLLSGLLLLVRAATP